MLVFAVSIVIVINGLVYVLTGAETDTQLFQNQAGVSWSAFTSSGQGIVTYVEGLLRLFGVVTAIVGAFGAVIAATAFRRGERWALYTLSLAALGLVYATADVYLAGGSTWPVYLVLLIVDVAGLLLPYKRFFSRDELM